MRYMTIVLTFLLMCGTSTADEFGDYWYQGKAELTSYDLEQAQYGEIHEGHAVLIFVTEDFSRSKQVKLDRPRTAGADAVKVLKLNFTKKFNTGVYPYSMMASIFTPVNLAQDERTLKISTSSQEWCGHTFTQLNLRDGSYEVELKSYFEGEGDEALELDGVLTEDEIWNRIRLSPSSLPTGKVRVIPGTMYQRLRHGSWQVEEAVGSLVDAGDPEWADYTLNYPELKRTLTIRFRKAFPHEIESWAETDRSGFGPGATTLTTKATKHKRILLDYWRHNSVADAHWRKQLGLD